ncbi:hypothetical protein U1Q18_008985 [Sarracenia purpurea var. burkii]
MSSSVCRRLHGLFATAKTTTSIPITPKTITTVAAAAAALNPSSSSTSNDKILGTVVRKFKKACESKRFRKGASGAYETTVRRLAASKNFSYIEEILEHQKKYAEITDEGFVVRLISLYGKSGMYEHAYNLFAEMPELKCERTVKSFNALLFACVNSKKFDQMCELLRDLPDKLSITPDKVSYNIIIKALCELGSFDSALSVIDEMDKRELEPDVITFNTLLDAFYRNGRFSDAENLWALMKDKNVVPDVRSYNPKLRALVADNQISEAVALIDEMGRKGILPDLFSFNALIKGFCDVGNMEEAKRWYKEIAKVDCKADRVTFTMLVTLACDKEDFDFALELCKVAIANRCHLNPSMLQLVVDGLVKESNMEGAKELVELGKSNNYFHYKLEIFSDQ